MSTYRLSFLPSVRGNIKQDIVAGLRAWGIKNDIPFRFGAMTCKLQPHQVADVKKIFPNELQVEEYPSIHMQIGSPAYWLTCNPVLLEYGLNATAETQSFAEFSTHFCRIFGISEGEGFISYHSGEFAEICLLFTRYFSAIEEMSGLCMSVPDTEENLFAALVPAYVAYFFYQKNKDKSKLFYWDYSVYPE